MGVGFSRMDQPGYIIRLAPGPNPPETALSEIYRPPEEGYGPRGIAVDFKGVVWIVLSSGNLARFDRPLNGPAAASGTLCPEGWTLYRMPGPQFRDATDPGSANHAYYVWVDRYNTLGLGPNVPIASTNGGESIPALVDEKLVELGIPYPMGLFSKNVDGRIEGGARACSQGEIAAVDGQRDARDVAHHVRGEEHRDGRDVRGVPMRPKGMRTSKVLI